MARRDDRSPLAQQYLCCAACGQFILEDEAEKSVRVFRDASQQPSFHVVCWVRAREARVSHTEG
jgi:hypothetical protein